MKNLRHHPLPKKKKNCPESYSSTLQNWNEELDPNSKLYRQLKTQFSRFKEFSISVSEAVPVTAPGPLWVSWSQSLGKQALIITGGTEGCIFKEFGRPQQGATTVFGKR